MDIVALESFVTVYNYKNFTKAADKLYISQPALSRRMKALEEELGITLFKRRGTSIEGITEGGKFFYKEAVKLLKQADELRLKVNRFREGVSGTLRIAVSPDFSLSVVLKAIQKMSIEWTTKSNNFSPRFKSVRKLLKTALWWRPWACLPM